MDELDAKIIATLRQNGRASNAGIARSAGVSEGTVRRRLRRLIDEEHIFVAAIPNPAMMGNPFEALIGVQVDPDKADLVAAAMAVMDELSWVTVSTGPYDIYGWVTIASPSALNDFLRTRIAVIPGVRRTETYVHLDVKKRSYGIATS
ncbi:Uncharacterized HTH-type transcriptional regulator PF1231 [Geodia barretti]|uniref:Uncharacterized HTH-type transcriptional regulator PF1231 n=1 Tax=Geodia barretti TaxID=519541 RepID=A0AA35RDK8_GEOBA|nr:Uncharacterized HTH-type transcriptional regulator PF1231 [Geodia barretti]